MYPLYKDMKLSEEQKQIVRDYIKEVNFSIPGTSPQDYEVVDIAKYTGWNFRHEDLEAFAVGLRCTKPGYQKYHTFIRMSRGQLLALAEAPRLPVNEPVLANEAMRLQRWRDTPTGPSRTGINTYCKDDTQAVPGVDMDLTMMEDTLKDIQAFAQGTLEDKLTCQFDLAVEWGALLAGRYPRLTYFRDQNRLSSAELKRLKSFEEEATRVADILKKLKLPTLQCLATPENRRHRQHNRISQ